MIKNRIFNIRITFGKTYEKLYKQKVAANYEYSLNAQKLIDIIMGARLMKNTLWTRDFTVITIGSAVSMLGNSLANFATSLFVLDYTESTLLYSIYIFLYTMPQIVAPILAGPLMDRFSRRKTIYTLDFISTIMYLLLGFVIFFDFFNFGILAASTLLLGISNGIYKVAFQSFYPMLITEGNFSKAYSVSSTLETLTYVMIPVATVIYNAIGLAPLLIVNSFFFLIAAIFEKRISDVEKELKAPTDTGYGIKHYIEDSKAGFRYLFSEKGLLYVAIYFAIINCSGGASQVITLPWFKATFENGEYIYLSVWAFMVIGRTAGGLIHYVLKLPVQKKFIIALLVYVINSLLEGAYLYTPFMVMRVACLLMGILGITSYTIRASATQSHVPTEMKGRFNGAFTMLETLGATVGQISAGALSEIMDMRIVLMLFMAASALFAIIIIGGNKKHIAPLYNRQT